MLRVTDKTGCTKDFAKIVSDGYYNQIRHMEQPAGQIFIELGQVAKLYGAREKIDPEVMKEAARLIVERFSFISIGEIREAYRQKSTGDIKAPGSEMFGGEFNVDQLGKVLGAYCQKRKKVLGAYLSEKRDMEESKAREEREEKLRKQFEIDFPKLLEEAKENMTDWRQVPYHWYATAYRRGMLNLTEKEVEEIGAEAMRITKAEQQEEKSEMNIMEALMKNEKSDPYQRAETIARKMIVFRKLIQCNK